MGLTLGSTLSAQSEARQIEFTEFDLDNGLHVILHEDHATPLVAVTVLYHVGSKNEDPSRTGMAHFFEHLLFEGSEHIGRGEFDTYVENAGGVLNANTSMDRTFYYELLPSNQLELGLWLESERMLHAKIEQIGIDTQNEVVKEESANATTTNPTANSCPRPWRRRTRSTPTNGRPLAPWNTWMRPHTPTSWISTRRSTCPKMRP